MKDESGLFQIQPYGESSVVVNQSTVSPTFLELGKALIVSEGLVFSPYKQGSGLSRPLGFTQVLSHLAYSAKSKYSLCLSTENYFLLLNLCAFLWTYSTVSTESTFLIWQTLIWLAIFVCTDIFQEFYTHTQSLGWYLFRWWKRFEFSALVRTDWPHILQTTWATSHRTRFCSPLRDFHCFSM